MKDRCRNPNSPGYRYYGGRGITVCERWLGVDGFVNFLADMGEKPDPEYSIDRIDNDGNYEPGNCRWATQSEQNANRRPAPMSVEAQAKAAATVRAKTAERNEAIRRDLAAGIPTVELASKYSLSRVRIQKIVKGLPRDRSRSPDSGAKGWATRRANAAARA